MNSLLKKIIGLVLVLVGTGPLLFLDDVGVVSRALSSEKQHQQHKDVKSRLREPLRDSAKVQKPASITTITMRPNQTGVIHLGKCGGLSMKHTIEDKKQPNKIKERKPFYYHMERPNITMSDTWIALIRDPVDRLSSGYIYEHPKNKPFRVDGVPNINFPEKFKLYDCYPNFDSLVTIGLPAPTLVNGDCPMLAQKLLTGYPIADMAHFANNFAVYYKSLLAEHEKKKVYIVRTENMLQDLKKVNVMMGGSADSFTKIKTFEHFTTKNLPVSNRSMSVAGRRNLCRIICSEILIYKKLLAIGLNTKGDTKAALSSISAKCPEEVKLDECPHIPQIKKPSAKDVKVKTA